MHTEILEAMPDAVVVADGLGRLEFVNRRTSELFGYDEGWLVGQPLDILIPSRFRPLHGTHHAGFFAAPRVRPMGLGVELVGLKKDGTEFPVDISLAPFQFEGETYAIAAIRDISERKRLEERERQLKTVADEVRRRDEVLAIASHELRAPVGSLQLQVEVLHRTASDAAAELNAMHDRMGSAAAELSAMRDRMGRVERHARRLARLVGDLLEVSDPHSEVQPLKLEDIDLSVLTREVVGSLRDEVNRTGSSVAIQAEAPVHGQWDPIRIEQIIANLLLNAAKFGRGNPITVRVEGDDELARIVVTDQGVGIGAEDRERIFGRFERAASPVNVLGLGLGLFIARRLTQAHSGSIRLQSSIGVGSTFTVELPRTPALGRGPESRALPSPAEASGGAVAG